MTDEPIKPANSVERHRWLEAARVYSVKLLDRAGCKVPENVRITVGFPIGARKAIGQAHYSDNVSDGVHEVFVSPVLRDSVTIVATLIHELIHTANPTAKHGGAFKKDALAVGLTGKMTATVAGDKLRDAILEWVAKHGEYPAGAISLTDRKKQTTRLLKAECETCGYIVRVTGKWVTEVGPPHCPDHGAMAVEGVSEEDPEAEPDGEGGFFHVDPDEPLIDPEGEDGCPNDDDPPEPDETDEDHILDGYRVVQADPEHDRFMVFGEDERPAAEAKARQWSKTGKEKTAVCEAHRDGALVGSKSFHGGLASAVPPSGDYPL